MSNKIYRALLAMGILCTSTILSKAFIVKNELDEDIKLRYTQDTSLDRYMHEIGPCQLIVLPAHETYTFVNNNTSWRIDFTYKGTWYLITRCQQDSLIVDGLIRMQDPVLVPGAREKIEDNDKEHEIVIRLDDDEKIEINLLNAPGTEECVQR